MDASVTSPHYQQRESDTIDQVHHDQLLTELSSLDHQDLRVRWRKLLRTQPPDLQRTLLLRLLAYRLQARAYGNLDRETVRYLNHVARESLRRKPEPGRRNAKAPPPIPPVPTRSRLKPGTLLAREFNGTIHRVTVTHEGFSWQGNTHSSLSEIARLITGTRWNGPRFFGLRDKLEKGQVGEKNP
ncbi:DUF2924 domain-containing protein [Microvirga yunnanensis]|uniref:DUF2924 domain-containing protein n=1 Tax=Microvirga yunnanensis TaxID=2953740 RepID=UPI0021C8BBFA|nr:DUF2924 domain-containing protein [Microvirga sp. HBU65207]